MGESEIILHLGAHRTGTTGLQNYLKNNNPIFAKNGYATTFPPTSRRIKFSEISRGPVGTIYSEENSTGYMEENINSSLLYPNIKEYSLRLGDIIKSTNIVIFSIREIYEYWNSSIMFCIKNGTAKLPSEAHLEKISSSSRGWSSVVSELSSNFPKETAIHIKDHRWKLGNPKQQLKSITNIPFVAETKSVKNVHNPKPDMEYVIDILKKSGDTCGAHRLAKIKGGSIFTAEQIYRMKDRYLDDLNEIKKMRGVILHTASEVKNAQR